MAILEVQKTASIAEDCLQSVCPKGKEERIFSEQLKLKYGYSISTGERETAPNSSIALCVVEVLILRGQ